MYQVKSSEACSAASLTAGHHRQDHNQQGQTKSWSDQKLLSDIHEEFYNHVDYQMSLGLPFLVRMYWLSFDPDISKLPLQSYKTEDFFPRTYQWYRGGDSTFHEASSRSGYKLVPLEEGQKGYELHLIIPTIYGDRLWVSKKPVFADVNFVPPHLGDLGDEWSVT